MGEQKKRFLQHSVWERILSFCMALALILTLLPAAVLTASATAGDTLYLKPNGNWLTDSARFAMYYYSDGSPDGWVDMTDEDGDGIYEGIVPAGYSNIIFCRMNSATTENNWDNKWNQTSDLTVPTDGKNLCVITDWNNSSEWSTYTPAGEETPDPVTYTVTFNTNGGSTVEAQTVNAGETATEPTAPTQDGYTFDGWYSDENLTAAYDFNTAVTGDLTLHAKWTENEATEDTTNETITVYFRNDWLWPEVYVHYWKDGSQGTTWPGEKMTFVETLEEGDVYSAEIPTWATGLLFNGLENGNDSNRQQTPDVTAFPAGDAYSIHWDGENKVSKFDYTPSTGETDPTDPNDPAEPVTWATVHYRNTGLWESVCGYAWTEGETDDQDTAISTWPGAVLTEESDHTNWYTLSLTDLNAANGIGVIFNNNNNGSQTANISITASGEYWYDGELLTEAPDNWTDGSVETVKYTATLHFANTLNWGSVSLYTWTTLGTITGGWPGTSLAQGSDGFYSMTLTYEAPAGQSLNYIYSGGGVQTVDLSIAASEFDSNNSVEKWVVLTNTVTDSEGNTKYNGETFDDPEAIAISPVVNDNSVTFEYKNETAGAVYVAGSMSEWSLVPMSKNSFGVWSITLNDVGAGVHQYKFIVDDSWITDPLNSWIITEDSGNQNSAFLISDPEKDVNTVTLNIHYTRADGNYDNWNAHVWTLDMAEQFDFTAAADGHRVTTVKVVGRETQAINFIIRKSVGTNLWVAQLAQQSISLANIVSGTIDVYVTVNSDGSLSVKQTLSDDVVYANKISSVELNYDNNTISITTLKALDDPETAFSIYNIESEEIENIITSVTAIGSTCTLTLSETLDLVTLYSYKIRFAGQEKFADYNYDIGINTVYASEKFGNEFTYTGTDLGANWTADSTKFVVWAPTAAAVSVNLYKSGTAGTDDLTKSVEMTKGDNGTWVATVDGDQNGVYYTYSVTRDGETVEAVDPYARTTGVNGKRGMVIDLDCTDPTDWASDKDPNPLASYTDAIIYELHVRDFSIDDSSGVKDEWQGKFLGLTQTGTTSTDGKTVTGLDYLKDLGITHLHLLPVYDYGSVDETTCSTFNWGYDPVNYNVPEGSYSTDPYNGEVRVEEFKEMVSTLHDNDISVIMDVVYNHVYDAGLFCINQIVPGYFSRQNSDGSYSNGSGCGNDTASEREMVRKYIVDSVNYWADEYHVDGFRFDLVGLLDTTTINEIVNTVHINHPGALFYGEGWTLGTAVEPGNTMATQANSSATPEFAYFSDTIRNLLGGKNGTSLGFVSGLTGQEEAVANNFMASPWWTSNPTQIIQYASCHDNYTLIDKLVLSTGKSSIDDEIIKMNNLAAAIYLTSQGIPFIHAGEEFLREKLEEDGGRCENSYNAPDSVNHIEWSNLENATYAANSDYYEGLIEFRKAHEALRMSTNAEVKANVAYTWVTNEVVMFTIDGKAAGDISDSIVVIFNATNSPKSVTLPSGEWSVCIDGQNAGTKALRTASGSVTVDGISAMVLVQGGVTTEEPAEETFEIERTNMRFGSDLSLLFAFKKSDLTDVTGVYAEITKAVDGGENEVVTVSSSDWTTTTISQESYYVVEFEGFAAKEMTDEVTVQILDAEGNALSEEYVTSIRAYAMEILGKTTNTEYQTAIVDMLNYGAAAQTYFSNYNGDELANALLTDAQKALASAEGTYVDQRVKDDTYFNASNLRFVSKINLIFRLKISADTYAVFTWTDHNGNEKTARVDGSEYTTSSGMYVVELDELVVADARQLVTCTIYDSNDQVVTTVVDSVESNAARRTASTADLYVAFMKFADAAYTYMH